MFVVLMGVLLITACSPKATEAPPARMPCSTIDDYETSEETDFYQSVVDQQPPITDEDWVYGNFDAPITIVLYEDFQCPACPGRSLGVKQLINEFPDSIRAVFRHLPLPSIHDKAYISSMAAEAAGAQGKFWEMHDILYINQQTWSGLPEKEFVDWVKDQAQLLGLDLLQFDQDLNDKDARAALEKTTQERLSIGMNYTPFMVVNDRVWRDNNPSLYGLIGIYEYDGYRDCPPWVIDEGESYLARLETSVGEIELKLYADKAPLAVNSFVFLAENGWFDDAYFHRVIEGFVAQSGDPSGQGVIGPGYTFVNETDNDLSYDRAGVLGMANAGVDTNGSQFFITLAPATDLDGNYTIFGEVTEASLPVLEKIALRNPQNALEAADFTNATKIISVEIIKE